MAQVTTIEATENLSVLARDLAEHPLAEGLRHRLRDEPN